MKAPVTIEQAAQIEAAKQAANVPGNVRRQIGAAALASQQVDLSKYYYSRIRFQADNYAQGVLTFEASDRYAFSYNVRQDVDGHPGHKASYADTNIIDERSTNKGETVLIRAMAVRNTPITDAGLAFLFDMYIGVSLRLDNQEILYLGNPSDIPGSAQLDPGPSFIIPTQWDSYVPAVLTPCTKGQSRMENMLVFSEPIIWKPVGNDAKLDVKFSLTKNMVLNADPARIPGGPGTLPTAWAPPANIGDPGTYVDFFVKLYCETRGPRSVNQ